MRDVKSKTKPINVFNPIPRKLMQTIQILKQINLAHSMCGKTSSFNTDWLGSRCIKLFQLLTYEHKNKTIKTVDKRTKRRSKFNA